MTSLRPFRCGDLFRFNNVNLDVLTETFQLGFYMSYLAKHPEFYQVAEGAAGRCGRPSREGKEGRARRGLRGGRCAPLARAPRAPQPHSIAR